MIHNLLIYVYSNKLTYPGGPNVLQGSIKLNFKMLKIIYSKRSQLISKKVSAKEYMSKYNLSSIQDIHPCIYKT